MERLHWFKGNIHTHTNRSDGDSEPDVVVRWYRRNAYDFLVISDHNHLTLLDHQAKSGRFRKPLLIPGEEVSLNLNNGTGITAVHVNGIGIKGFVEPIDAVDVVSTLQANIDAVRNAGGIARSTLQITPGPLITATLFKFLTQRFWKSSTAILP